MRKQISFMDKRIVAALFFGSIWGIIEALLGGFMHLALPFFPYTGAIMVAMVMPIIIAASRYGRGSVLLSGAIAASFKLINFFIFPSISILRPMFSIVGEAALLELLIYFLPEARGSLLGIAAATGSLAGMLLPPARFDAGIAISIAIAALLCEITTKLRVELKPEAKSASALFAAALIVTLLL